MTSAEWHLSNFVEKRDYKLRLLVLLQNGGVRMRSGIECANSKTIIKISEEVKELDGMIEKVSKHIALQ